MNFPYWFPGGYTRPLSLDGLGTHNSSYTMADGLREAVHDPVHARQLDSGLTFVTD